MLAITAINRGLAPLKYINAGIHPRIWHMKHDRPRNTR